MKSWAECDRGLRRAYVLSGLLPVQDVPCSLARVKHVHECHETWDPSCPDADSGLGPLDCGSSILNAMELASLGEESVPLPRVLASLVSRPVARNERCACMYVPLSTSRSRYLNTELLNVSQVPDQPTQG